MKKLVLFFVVCFVAFGFSINAQAEPYDGIYKFDAETWKTEFSKIEPNMVKHPEMGEKIAESLKEMSVELKGKEITVTTKGMVVKGDLNEVKKTETETLFKMIPHDEDKKNEPLMVTLKGNGLVLMPEGNPKEAMYFKK